MPPIRPSQSPGSRRHYIIDARQAEKDSAGLESG
jgi:hypothetical protein